MFLKKKLNRGRSKMRSPGGGGRGSERSVTNGDKGGRGVLASGDVTIKKKFHLNISFCIVLKHFSQSD